MLVQWSDYRQGSTQFMSHQGSGVTAAAPLTLIPVEDDLLGTKPHKIKQVHRNSQFDPQKAKFVHEKTVAKA